MTRLIACVLGLVAASGLLGFPSQAQEQAADRSARTVRLKAPRIPPRSESEWTDADRALARQYTRDGGAGNDFRTFLHNPDTVKAMMPFIAYLSTDSSLAGRDREILILRTSWLAQSDYVWAHHAAAAKTAGLSDAEIRRVAEGPEAKGWTAFEVTLLQAADQLYRNGFINTPTWNALAARYDVPHLIDAVFTVTEFLFLSDTYNAIGMQPEASVAARLPADVAYRVRVPAREPQPAAARIEPVDFASASAETKAMLDPRGSGRGPTAVFRTVARNAKLYPPRQLVAEYTRRPNKVLSTHVQQLLILRASWLDRAAYQYSEHLRAGEQAGLEIDRVLAGPDAAGWDPFDAALVRATDELHRDDFISDRTWNALAARYQAPELMDVLITVGAYCMIGIPTSTFAVRLEPGARGLPPSAAR
jgi:4-carboxymuconolactone decarboxylase